jgi:hypothetical protein
MTTPVELRPIQWGKRDAVLARVVARSMAEANPPTIIPYNIRTHSRIRLDLRRLKVAFV